MLKVNPKLVEGIEIVKGILLGTGKAEGLSNLDSCITDAEPIVDNIKTAIADFKKKTAPAVVDGLKHIASAAKEI